MGCVTFYHPVGNEFNSKLLLGSNPLHFDPKQQLWNTFPNHKS